MGYGIEIWDWKEREYGKVTREIFKMDTGGGERQDIW